MLGLASNIPGTVPIEIQWSPPNINKKFSLFARSFTCVYISFEIVPTCVQFNALQLFSNFVVFSSSFLS